MKMIYGQQLNIGADLSKKYYVMGYAPAFNSGALYMEFSLGGEIPTFEDIKTNFYTDDELERVLHRVKRDELIEAWGEPTRHIDRENEDVWMLDERKALVISYTLFGRVDDAEIED